MKLEQINCDVAKEFLTILSYCDSSILKAIPKEVLEKINSLAADSLKDFYVNKNKTLNDQNMSKQCKELIRLIYFTYIKK